MRCATSCLCTHYRKINDRERSNAWACGHDINFLRRSPSYVPTMRHELAHYLNKSALQERKKRPGWSAIPARQRRIQLETVRRETHD